MTLRRRAVIRAPADGLSRPRRGGRRRCEGRAARAARRHRRARSRSSTRTSSSSTTTSSSRPAREWVAPYIGDLIGYRTLYGADRRRSAARAPRSRTRSRYRAAQGHRGDARAARARRHRLARARRRVLPAAGDDAVHQPPAPAERPPGTASAWPSILDRPSAARSTPPAHTADVRRIARGARPPRHPERRHPRLADPRLSAARGPRPEAHARRVGPALPVQPDRRGPALVQPCRGGGLDHRTSPSAPTCPSRSPDASCGTGPPTSTRTASS